MFEIRVKFNELGTRVLKLFRSVSPRNYLYVETVAHECQIDGT